MASDYGLNFGFRRSDEHLRTGTEGRMTVPATGTFTQGDLVSIDPANPGFMKLAAANAPIQPGFTGLIIQENAWDFPLHSNQIVSTRDLNVVYNSQLAAIWTGAGLKIWLKNTAARNVRGQRALAQVTKFTISGLIIGDYIGWDGAKYVEVSTEATAVAQVTLTNGTDYIEAVLLR